MQLTQITMVACALVAAAAGRKIPVDEKKGVHHSTKKELKDPNRFPRKSEVGDGTDLDPAIAYALPPVGLLHQGQGFGYGGNQGYEATALAALISSGLQEGAAKQPVYHATPLQYGALLDHGTPIEEPKQDEQAVQTAQAVQAQAHSFVNSPKYYSNNQHEDEYKDYAAKYQFGYRVRDLHTGNDFGQTESRDGHFTQGHYHVLLPDGRLQNVQYWSDHTGFHAKVSYDGHARHH